MHRLVFLFAVGLCTSIGSSAHAGSAPQAPVTALVGATVVDPGGATTRDAVVLLQGERILRVGTRARVRIPAGATVVNADGKWVIPGLIDAHVHFFQSGGLYTRPDSFDFSSARPYAEEYRAIHQGIDTLLLRTLRCGVTSVADVGGPLWNFEVRARANASRRAPRVVVTGPLVSTVARPALDLGDPPIVRCASPDEARALVRKEAAQRPDFIKIWYVVTPEETVAKGKPVVAAAIDEAHRLGLRAAVHATELAAAKIALSLGAEILVHSVMDVDVDDEFIALASAHHAIYIPTLIVSENYQRVATGQLTLSPEELAWGDPFVTGTLFDVAHLSANAVPPRVRDLRVSAKPIERNPVLARNLMRVQRAGITVAMGTDAGNIGTLHGASVFPELARMEEAGLSPLEALRTATVGGAQVMGRPRELGRVAPGFLADLLVLDADPALSTRNLSHIHRIIRGGVVLDPSALAPDEPEALAQRQLNAYNAHDLDAFVAVYAPDVEIRDLDGKIVVEGREPFRKLYAERFARSPQLHCELVKRMVLGSFVIDEERVTGAGPAPIHAAAIYEIKDGLIARVRFLR